MNYIWIFEVLVEKIEEMQDVTLDIMQQHSLSAILASSSVAPRREAHFLSDFKSTF